MVKLMFSLYLFRAIKLFPLALLAAFLFAGCKGKDIARSDARSSAMGKIFGGRGEDFGSSVELSPDGGYIVAGSTRTFMRDSLDISLIKTDDRGNIKWQRTIGGPSHDYASAIKNTIDGGYIIAGSTGNFDENSWDIYLIKTDGEGKKLWERKFSGRGEDKGNAVVETIDGGFAVAGYTGFSNAVPAGPEPAISNAASIAAYSRLYNGASWDAYLIKTDPDGNLLWEKTYGGKGDDRAESVKQTSDGGYLLAGRTETGGDYDVYLLKTDKDGKEAWSKTFGGAGDDRGCCTLEVEGGYIVLGRTRSAGAGAWDVYVVRTDAKGEKVWEKTFGRDGDDWGESIEQTPDGGFIIAGRTRPAGESLWDAYLIRIDGDGKALWEKTYADSGSEWASSVKQRPDTGFVVVGSKKRGENGSWDIYLLTTDSKGNPL